MSRNNMHNEKGNVSKENLSLLNQDLETTFLQTMQQVLLITGSEFCFVAEKCTQSFIPLNCVAMNENCFSQEAQTRLKNSLPFRIIEPYCYESLHYGGLISVYNMSDNPEIVPEKDCYGGVKLVCVPLFFGSKILGVLCMFSLKENFLPEQISCMEPFLLQITLCMELKLAQRELKDAVQARDKALGTEQKIKTFYSCFSHELRNVINGQLGAINLLCSTNMEAEQKEYAEIIQSSEKTVLDMLNNMLDHSKLQSGKMKHESIQFSVRDFLFSLSDVVAPSAHSKGLDLVIDIAPDVCHKMVGDQFRLGQVLINLLSNAVKFTRKGEVVLRCSSVSQDRYEELNEPQFVELPTSSTIRDGFMGRRSRRSSLELLFNSPVYDSTSLDVTELSESAYLHFSVRDTGIGIKSGNIQKIFQPYDQGDASISREYGGTGLGLSITKEIVSLLGGNLHVKSEEGCGSEFYFCIPLLSLREEKQTSKNSNTRSDNSQSSLASSSSSSSVSSPSSPNSSLRKQQKREMKKVPAKILVLDSHKSSRKNLMEYISRYCSEQSQVTEADSIADALMVLQDFSCENQGEQPHSRLCFVDAEFLNEPGRPLTKLINKLKDGHFTAILLRSLRKYSNPADINAVSKNFQFSLLKPIKRRSFRQVLFNALGLKIKQETEHLSSEFTATGRDSILLSSSAKVRLPNLSTPFLHAMESPRDPTRRRKGQLTEASLLSRQSLATWAEQFCSTLKSEGLSKISKEASLSTPLLSFFRSFSCPVTVPPNQLQKVLENNNYQIAVCSSPPTSHIFQNPNRTMDTSQSSPSSRALIVDDDSVNRKILQRQLQKLDILADGAEDGLAGLKLLAEGLYELVFIDMNMPLMHGSEVIAQLRNMEGEFHRKQMFVSHSQQQSYKKTRFASAPSPSTSSSSSHKQRRIVVAMSGSYSMDLVSLCKEHGADEFIQKPISSAQLKEIINQYNL